MTVAVDHLHSSTESTLTIPDLDAAFHIKIRTLIGLALPAMYTDFARHIDVAAMRKRGLVSVVSFIDLSRSTTPLPVGGTIAIDSQTRLCELSGVGPGSERARMGLEVRFDFRASPGTGDPRRYREVAEGAAPVSCGSGRMLLALIRPTAPPAERLVSEAPAEMAHLQVHTLDPAHPTAETLTALPAGFEAGPTDTLDDTAGETAGDTPGVWGIHHSDINQYVFTGEYISVMEDMFVRQVHAAGMPVATHRIQRARLLFKKPFAAGDGFRARARLHVHGDQTLLLAGIHSLDAEGGAFKLPGVLGRLDGQMQAPSA